MPMWNKVSNDCVHVSSLTVFKNRIDNYLVKVGTLKIIFAYHLYFYTNTFFFTAYRGDLIKVARYYNFVMIILSEVGHITLGSKLASLLAVDMVVSPR